MLVNALHCKNRFKEGFLEYLCVYMYIYVFLLYNLLFIVENPAAVAINNGHTIEKQCYTNI